jgi:hypothetical protein
MPKTILSIAAGFIAWSIVWLGVNAGLHGIGMLPADPTQSITSISVLLTLLVGSVVASVAAGYTTAITTPRGKKSPTPALGWVLITVGVFVQGMNLALMPLWYHIIFVALLLPAAAAGGRLRKIQETGK